MRVLITGGLGYVGGRLAVHLSSLKGYQVTVTTRKEKAETDRFPIPAGIRVIHGFSADGPLLDSLTGEADVIVHLASLNEVDAVQRPAEALQVNVLDSYRLLESAIKNGTRRFIYFSTAHIYGAPLKGHVTEKSVPRPVHPYAVTHRAFEDFVTAAMDNGRLETIVLRLSNAFGPPAFLSADRWTLLVNDLCRQAVCEHQLVLRSSGLQQRDFITLTDVCAAAKHFSDLEKEELRDGLFNLGGARSIRVIDMAGLISDRAHHLLGIEVVLSVPPATDGELQTDFSLEYNIDKLLATGFSPTGEVVEEIDNTILFCHKYLVAREAH